MEQLVSRLQSVLMIYSIIKGKNDYGAGPYNVTFLAGETAVTFDVTIISDGTLEGNENFNLFIDQASLPDRVIRGILGLASVTIVDDDGEGS